MESITFIFPSSIDSINHGIVGYYDAMQMSGQYHLLIVEQTGRGGGIA